MQRCSFYVVADSAYYVGAVAVVNSLRLLGHDEPVVVLDAGLTDGERHLLAREVEIVAGPRDVPPQLAKWVAPLASPSEVVVVLDADVVLTRPLGPLLQQATDGAVVAFADDRPDRFDEAWAEHMGVPALPRRTYVNAGFVALPPVLGCEILDRLRVLQTKLAQLGYTRTRHEDREGLFSFPDQDAWNAVLGAAVSDDLLRVLPRRLAPFEPPEAARVVDEVSLRCRTEGDELPYLLHHIGPKPWRDGPTATAYSRLLPRVLFGEDVVLRLDPSDFPPALRPGRRGAAHRLGIHAVQRSRTFLGRAKRPLFSGEPS